MQNTMHYYNEIKPEYIEEYTVYVYPLFISNFINWGPMGELDKASLDK